MLRESGMWEQRDLDSYARSTRKSPQNGTKNLAWRQRIDEAQIRLTASLVSAITVSNRRRET